MTTINISLPDKLKTQAEMLVENGFYASFSDLVRDSLRRVISQNRFDLWADQAKLDEKTGKAKVLKSKKDIDVFFNTLG